MSKIGCCQKEPKVLPKSLYLILPAHSQFPNEGCDEMSISSSYLCAFPFRQFSTAFGLDPMVFPIFFYLDPLAWGNLALMPLKQSILISMFNPYQLKKLGDLFIFDLLWQNTHFS
jgi:hypothetical protein